jgi:hypothetical protein
MGTVARPMAVMAVRVPGRYTAASSSAIKMAGKA